VTLITDASDRLRGNRQCMLAFRLQAAHHHLLSGESAALLFGTRGEARTVAGAPRPTGPMHRFQAPRHHRRSDWPRDSRDYGLRRQVFAGNVLSPSCRRSLDPLTQDEGETA
jgi:hypothetical protein